MTATGSRVATGRRSLHQRLSRTVGSRRVALSDLLGVMPALFVATLFANVGIGPVNVLPAQALSILLSRAGIHTGIQFEPRTVVTPAELSLGAVTAMVGGPFFQSLVHRTRRDWRGVT